MIEHFLKKVEFSSMEDFEKNLEFVVPENFNFAYDVMDRWAAEAPDKLALLWTNDKGEERRFTFADLKRMSDNIVSFLTALGIQKDDMVMCILKRRYQFWPLILALHKIGAVVIPATYLLTKKDIIYRCEQADIKAIVACGDEDIIEHIDSAFPSCPTVQQRISIGPVVPEGWVALTENDIHNGFGSTDNTVKELRRKHYGGRKNHMIMYFTSGTSGEPKMVMHDYTYALGHLATAAFWHNITPESLHLTVSDTGWGKAVWGKLYGQWIVGATVFVYDHDMFRPSDLLGMIAKYHVTSFCAPPTVYRYLVREDLKKYDLSSLQYATTAGEALNPSVSDKFFDLTGLRIREGFGQTETTCTLGTYKWMDVKLGSMGKPNPQYDIHLMVDGKEVGTNEVGEIVIRTAENIPLGLFNEYYRNEELTKEVWHDGYYHTGDLATRDEDGYYFYVGRYDDVIKSSGYRIGPFEVESALMTHPAVLECAVTAVPDEQRGQAVKATVVLARGYEQMKGSRSFVHELKEHVKKVTAAYKAPRIIEFVDELPKTISGKIRRVEIRHDDQSSAE
jgi:acetyl-CoA synthetase